MSEYGKCTYINKSGIHKGTCVCARPANSADGLCSNHRRAVKISRGSDTGSICKETILPLKDDIQCPISTVHGGAKDTDLISIIDDNSICGADETVDIAEFEAYVQSLVDKAMVKYKGNNSSNSGGLFNLQNVLLMSGMSLIPLILRQLNIYNNPSHSNASGVRETDPLSCGTGGHRESAEASTGTAQGEASRVVQMPQSSSRVAKAHDGSYCMQF